MKFSFSLPFKEVCKRNGRLATDDVEVISETPAELLPIPTPTDTFEEPALGPGVEQPSMVVTEPAVQEPASRQKPFSFFRWLFGKWRRALAYT